MQISESCGRMNELCPSVHKVHIKFAPDYFLYLIMPKNSIFSPLAKDLHPLQGFTPSLTTSSTHTQNMKLRFVLGPLQFQSTGQSTNLTDYLEDFGDNDSFVFCHCQVSHVILCYTSVRGEIRNFSEQLFNIFLK